MDNMKEPLIPVVCQITDIRQDTPDVKTFRVLTLDGQKPFIHKPGQCAMLSMPGVGEALFSITSSPTNTKYVEFSIKKCGCVTDWLHQAEPDQQITIRGPYGKPFPVVRIEFPPQVRLPLGYPLSSLLVLLTLPVINLNVPGSSSLIVRKAKPAASWPHDTPRISK